MRNRLMLTAVILLAAATSAAASGPRIWALAGAEDFAAGEVRGTSIDAHGEAVLAPAMNAIVEPGAPRVWAFLEAPDGTVFGSWGEQGRIHRVGDDGQQQTVARLDGVAAQAMAWGPDGHLYVAAGPEAAVYRIAPDSEAESPEPWYEVGTRYVWAMAFDAAGRLWLGTGGDGRIVRVSADGVGEVVYDTPEPHVTALTVVPAGGVVAGTEGNGYVYRIDGDDAVSVLFDAPQREITDLLWRDGVVFAAAFGADDPGNGGNGSGNGSGSGRPAARGPANGNAESAAGALFRIDADGLVRTLWSDDSEGPYALAVRPNGDLVVGTGPEGRLLSVSGTGVGLLADFEAAQVVGLATGTDRLMAATSNPGAVHALGTAYRREGQLISPVHDAGATATWGEIRTSVELPSGTSVGVETRSGNTGDPDDTWSSWQPVRSVEGAATVDSPPGRFLQWRATLGSPQGDATPRLRRIEVAFVVRNLPPKVEELTVHPGGVVYRQNSGFDDGMPFAQVPPAIARQLESSGSAPASGSFLGRPYYVAGLRTFTWEGSDPNDDALRYDLAVRGELERAWKPVVADLEGRMFVLDTRRLPDGPYYARLAVSDAASRPRGESLRGHRDSAVFIVDNTAPELSGLGVSNGSRPTLSAVARDATSLIARLEYSVDGGDWRTVRPRDGVADAAREELAVELEELSPGEHTVIVRAVDTAQNVATAKVVFVVEPTGQVENADD